MLKNKKKVVCAIQLEIRPERPEQNLNRVLKKVRKAAEKGADLIVLPEMWYSGYDYKNLEQTSDRTNLIIKEFEKISNSYNTTIISSMVERDGKYFFNTAFTVEPHKGVIGKYRKIHLFPLLREDKYFKRGNSSDVLITSSGKIGTILCFDIRFPELTRSLALNSAEIIVIPAQWPRVRVSHWRTLLQARAIENQLFVIGAACCGGDRKLVLSGNSMIVDPNGKVLKEAGEGEEVIKTEIDLNEIDKARAKIPCFQCRAPKAYV